MGKCDWQIWHCTRKTEAVSTLDERKSLAVKHRLLALLPLADRKEFEPLHEHRRATTQQLQSMLVPAA